MGSEMCIRDRLHAAVAGEHDLAVDYLHLEKKLPLDRPDRFGWCPLHYASSIRAHDTLCRLLQLGASSTRGDERGWLPLDIVRCDDPEDEIVQRMCSILESSSLQETPPANVPTILRPAWIFATCKLAEFKQMIPEDMRDWWLPDPRRGNLVCTSALPTCESTNQTRRSTVPLKRTTYHCANCSWTKRTSTQSTPKEIQLCSSPSTSTKHVAANTWR